MSTKVDGNATMTAAIASLSATNPEAAAALAAAGGGCDSTTSPGQNGDERALLMLLQDEVKRLQKNEQSRAASHNEARTLLEMKVAIEQLEAVTEQRRRLAEDVAKERAAGAKLKQRVAELERDAELRAEQRKVAEHHLNETIADLRQHVDRLSFDGDAAKTKLAAAEKDLSLTKDRAVAAKKEYTATEQNSFEQATVLKTRLTHALNEIDALKECALSEAGQRKEREYDLMQSVAAAQRERNTVAGDLAAERRAHIEDVADLKKALHEARQTHATMESTFDANHRLDREKLIRLTSELQLMREKAESDAAAAAAREKTLDEQNMKMVSDLRAAQTEINAMSNNEWTDKKALTQKLIEVTVARDLSVQNASELKDKLHMTQQDYTASLAALQNQLSQANSRLENDSARRNVDAAEDRQRLLEAQGKLATAEEDVARLRQQRTEQSQEVERTLAVKDSELHATRVELRATVDTLHRLERAVQENVQVKLLTDENASLREQCAALKTRVVEMTSNLANMRAEADTSENARVSSMQGLVADYHRRIVALEKEQRFSRPLIKDLAALCRKHSLLDTVLERDLELYTTNFRDP